jgi:hypothetical protein
VRARPRSGLSAERTGGRVRGTGRFADEDRGVACGTCPARPGPGSDPGRECLGHVSRPYFSLAARSSIGRVPPPATSGVRPGPWVPRACLAAVLDFGHQNLHAPKITAPRVVGRPFSGLSAEREGGARRTNRNRFVTDCLRSTRCDSTRLRLTRACACLPGPIPRLRRVCHGEERVRVDWTQSRSRRGTKS